MQTIKIEVDDSKVEIILNIINNLKSNIITNYETINESSQEKEFPKLSESEFMKIWDNKEDIQSLNTRLERIC